MSSTTQTVRPDVVQGYGTDLAQSLSLDLGRETYALAAELYPIPRSITGAGVRQSLSVLGRKIDIEIHEVPTGTRVLDWSVPKEWTLRDAWIVGPDGRRVLDLGTSSLHVVSYSSPVDVSLSLDELKAHLHTVPDKPDVIPYRTSYYAERWGFCMTHRQMKSLPPGPYRAMIDATLADGHLTYGEYLHRGASTDEVLLSTHICHPSLANDNCSGMAVLTALAQHLRGRATRLSYRFVFAPTTIGSITWLARNEANLSCIKHGLVVANLGDGAPPVYKRSRRGSAIVDRAATHVFQHDGRGGTIEPFLPFGYDERQYCSPGFDLPVGSLQRSKWGAFPEYHTSADNLDFITPDALAQSAHLIASMLDVLDVAELRPRNLSPKGEPQLGRRGLYPSLGGDLSAADQTLAILWVLNLADGQHTLLDMAERASLPMAVLLQAAQKLSNVGLLA